MARVQIPGSGGKIVEVVFHHLAAEALGGTLDLGEIVLILGCIAADDIPFRPLLPDQVLRQGVGAHRVVRNDMEDVLAAFLLAQLGRAGADVHDERVFGLGQIGHGQQIVGLEVGDEEAVAGRQRFLGFRHDVLVCGDDDFLKLEAIADEITGLVRLLQHEARALDAFVGDHLLRIGERERLFVFLTEIDDMHRLLGGVRLCSLRLAGIRRSVVTSLRLRVAGLGRRLGVICTWGVFSASGQRSNSKS